MQGNGTFVFLGIKSFPGKKDPSKTFYNLSLLQGTETFSVFLDDGQNVLFEKCDLYDNINIDFAVFLRTDRGMTVMSLRILKINSISTQYGETVDLSPEIPAHDGKTINMPLQADKLPEKEKTAKAV